MDAHSATRPRIGMMVVDSHDHVVGTVEAVEHDHFVVGKGLFFSQPQRIPASAIGDFGDGELRLRITRETALHNSVDTHWADYPDHGEIVQQPATDDAPPG